MQTEIAGSWYQVKSFFLELGREEIHANVISKALNDMEHVRGWKNDTLVSIDDSFEALDAVEASIIKAFGEAVWRGETPPKPALEYIMTASSKLYHGFRSKIQSGAFDTSSPWPEADLSTKDLVSRVQLAPEISPMEEPEIIAGMQEVMRQKVIDLQKQGDLAADVFDIITSKWLREAKHPESMMNITVNEILESRGIQRRPRPGESRSGFDQEQRKIIAKQVELLCFAWIEVGEMEITEVVNGKRKRNKWRGESKALIASSRIGQVRFDNTMEPFAWTLRPGDVFSKFLFGPGRETAQLSCKALHYDYYRNRWEKRLARYVSWQWKISEKRQSWRVKTLLDGIEEKTNKNRPARTKDRLEKALDTLKEDAIISGWKYERLPKNLTSRRGWWRQWEDCLVTITAPQELLDQYKGLIEKRNKYRGGGKLESKSNKKQS